MISFSTAASYTESLRAQLISVEAGKLNFWSTTYGHWLEIRSGLRREVSVRRGHETRNSFSLVSSEIDKAEQRLLTLWLAQF